MLPESNVVLTDQIEEQIQRILDSDGFRNADVVQRLLRYLAAKSISGAGDRMKEYTVAVEGLGKPASYDPQKTSSVRIQAGRLRQKLADYYSGVGKEDAILLEMAKGSFHLTVRRRSIGPEGLADAHEEDAAASEHFHPAQPPVRGLFSRQFLIGVLVGCVILGCGWLFAQFAGAHPKKLEAAPATWTPEMQTLWAPFVKSQRPLIISIEDPLFVQFDSNPGVFYRDRSKNTWSDLQRSTALRTIAMEQTSRQVQPSRYFTSFGEVEASLLLGRLLGPHVEIFSLSRSSELTWNQMANNNVLFVGVQYSFFKQMKDLPITSQLVPTNKGVANLQPAPGEPAVFVDRVSKASAEEGVVYALVTHLPGPSGSTEVESFTSNRAAGYVAAVQWFTEPNSAKLLVEKLKRAGGGTMPRYYQVLLKITCKDGVPTEISYVLGRALK
jgi:hypothetical protein